MSDSALPEPTALPALSDAPPSSAGRESGHSGALDQHQPQPQPQPQAAVSDELKARLDKVVNSEVSRQWLDCSPRLYPGISMLIDISPIDRHHHPPYSSEAKRGLRPGTSLPPIPLSKRRFSRAKIYLSPPPV